MKFSEPKSIVTIKLDAINSKHKRARDLHDIIFLLDKRKELFTLPEYEEMQLLSINLERLYEFKVTYESDNILEGCFYDDIELLVSIFSRDTLYRKSPSSKDENEIIDLDELIKENKKLNKKIFDLEEYEFQRSLANMKEIAVLKIQNKKLTEKLAVFMPPTSNLGILKKIVRF
jgi:hypothetical protein